MKKICFVLPRAYYLFNSELPNFRDIVGGAQKQAYLLSTLLAENEEFDVNFCVADFDQADFEIIQKVKIWKSLNFRENKLKSFFKLFSTIKKINADIYIFRAADLGVSVFCLAIRFLLKKRTIYMLGADVELSFKTNRRQFGFLTAFLMYFTYKLANKITAQSNQQFKLFYKNYHRKPNAIIRNIIEIQHFDHDSVRNEILWVGRLDKIKNPEIFISLAEKYPNETFKMIAPIITEYADFGEKICEKAKKLANLELIEFVKPEEINSYYKKSKIYVMTSESEGFSNTMLESMACGCSVLSFKVNNDNIITQYNFGICADGNLDKFYHAFEKMVGDNILNNEFGKNALKYVIENHGKEKIMSDFEQILC